MLIHFPLSFSAGLKRTKAPKGKTTKGQKKPKMSAADRAAAAAAEKEKKKVVASAKAAARKVASALAGLRTTIRHEFVLEVDGAVVDPVKDGVKK